MDETSTLAELIARVESACRVLDQVRCDIHDLTERIALLETEGRTHRERINGLEAAGPRRVRN